MTRACEWRSVGQAGECAQGGEWRVGGREGRDAVDGFGRDDDEAAVAQGLGGASGGGGAFLRRRGAKVEDGRRHGPSVSEGSVAFPIGAGGV